MAGRTDTMLYRPMQKKRTKPRRWLQIFTVSLDRMKRLHQGTQTCTQSESYRRWQSKQLCLGLAWFSTVTRVENKNINGKLTFLFHGPDGCDLNRDNMGRLYKVLARGIFKYLDAEQSVLFFWKLKYGWLPTVDN